MEPNNNYVISNTCIAKDFDSKPVVLYIDDFDEKLIALKPKPDKYNKPLWFPRNVVFTYQKSLLEKLRDAYEKGDEKLLKSLWSQAKLWEPEEN